MHTSIGIYINSEEDLNHIPKILEFYKNKYKSINPNLFTDLSLNKYLNMSYLSSFYMEFCKYILVFTSMSDFLENQYNIISNDIHVITSMEEIKNYHMNKNNVLNLKLLTYKDGDLYEI